MLGTTENTITYTSLAQSDPAAAAKSDSKHSLKLTVKQRHAMHSLVETAPRGPLSGMIADSISPLST